MIDDDYAPLADPAIRSDYEAALGAFILAFNEADYYVGQIVGWQLRQGAPAHVAESILRQSLRERLDMLQGFGGGPLGGEIAELPFDRLRAINTDRNRLAHGHFEQNPFDGRYQLVLAQKAADYPVARVRQLTRELDAIVERLRATYFGHFFNADADGGRGVSD